MQETKRLRIAIVGGSLGGLNAACALRDAGHDVSIFERSRKPLSGRGAGLVLHPATVRYLMEEGGTRLNDISVTASCVRYFDRTGQVLRDESCRLRLTSYFALYQALLQRLPADRYRLDQEVVGLRQNESGVTLSFSDGSDAGGWDLAVFADGIHSTARRLLLPEVSPHYSGYVAWRGTIDKADLSHETFSRLADTISYYVAPGTHILTYPIPSAPGASEHRLTNWVWYWNVREGEELAELMTDRRGQQQTLSLAPGSVRSKQIERLRAAALAELPPPLAETVSATTDPFVQAIVDIAVPRMVFGRACLIGDAAFAVRPHVAAGTAKAAEDGWKLAQMLESAINVDETLSAWERGQLALGRSVLSRAREAGDSIQRNGLWRPGDPLPFGLYEEGDNAL